MTPHLNDLSARVTPNLLQGSLTCSLDDEIPPCSSQPAWLVVRKMDYENVFKNIRLIDRRGRRTKIALGGRVETQK